MGIKAILVGLFRGKSDKDGIWDFLSKRAADRSRVDLEKGYGQDKPERGSKPAWPSSRASTFGTAEGPIAGGAVCSLKPLTRFSGRKLRVL